MINLSHVAPLNTQKEIPEFIHLNDETMKMRLEKVRSKMAEKKLDVLIVYGDLEHGSNYEYLTGFLPRFEESILVLHARKPDYLLLGNENLNKAGIARIKADPIHVPFFSLPNQPMEDDAPLEQYFEKAGLARGMRVGISGWKHFTSTQADNRKLFDIPHYLLEAIKNAAVDGELLNATDIFIGENGVRTTCNANEIAHYEFGSVLAAKGMQSAMEHVKEGISEMELGSYLDQYGQDKSVVTIASTGTRFEHANLYPSNKKVARQDKMALTVGYRGGLSSRSGYAVSCGKELPKEAEDWQTQLAEPYFNAVVHWLETIHIGMSGNELYHEIEKVLPSEIFHWSLCPGHLIGDEEWLSSPIYKGSKELLRSGMLLQLDIIPQKKGYGGANCETGILLADSQLKQQIEQQYPDLYHRMKERRHYIQDKLGIRLNEDVLPMNDTVGYYAPYFLSPDFVFVQQDQPLSVL